MKEKLTYQLPVFARQAVKNEVDYKRCRRKFFYPVDSVILSVIVDLTIQT